MDNIETTKNKVEEKKPHKLFNYCMCNPPYQEDKRVDNCRQAPVYHDFMDAVYDVCEVTELITPARFLFDAGQTPKKWNKKMLNDEHFKVMKYEADSKQVFPNVIINGGTAVTIHDTNKTYDPIEAFTPFKELNTALQKVKASLLNDKAMTSICVGGVPYKFSNKLKEDDQESYNLAADSFDLRSNVFDKLAGKVFHHGADTVPNAVAIWGLYKRKRAVMYVNEAYLIPPANFYKYKVIVPQANGSGAIGEVLSTPLIGEPLTGHTQTFISFGSFDTEKDAENCLKYIKTKFARAMLGILKVTPVNAKDTWRFVPLQDFTPQSDIDWSVSIPEIDQQLYAKYGLTEKEIEFIETHVKPMS